MRRLEKGKFSESSILKGIRQSTLFSTTQMIRLIVTACDTIQGQGKPTSPRIQVTLQSQDTPAHNRCRHLWASRHLRSLFPGKQHHALFSRQGTFPRLQGQFSAWSAGLEPDLGKRDLPFNVNFFMNVPVTPEGG